MPSTSEAKFILSAKDQTKSVFRGFNKNLKGVGKAVTGVKAQVLGLVGIGGFGALVAGVIETNKEFQTLQASLKTVTGSAEEADRAFDQIEHFARNTPFDINQVTQSFIKLKALGLDPSEEAIMSYGNTASAMGKSLDQMIEAVADATTGEFERLKEFGIKAKKQGDQVEFTFQGVTTTIRNSSEEITGYLQGIGSNQFGGAMKEQMNTLGGAFSNFGGAVDGLQKKIGEAGLNDMVVELTQDMTEFIDSLDEDQIRKFSSTALSTFADVVEGSEAVITYMRSNNLIEMGLIGYLLFGKKGLALAALVNEVNTMMANDVARNWDFLFRSNITGQPTREFSSNYQLGDFNRAFPIPSDSFGAWSDRIQNQDLPQLDETNSLLGDIVERLRESSVAVAG